MNQEFMLTLEDIQEQSVNKIETIFALANGHLGVRASSILSQQAQATIPGTFVNGFYGKSPITYGEWAHGYAENHQTIVNLPDMRALDIRLNGLTLEEGRVTAALSEQQLNLKTGCLSERYDLKTASGERLVLSVESFASVKQQEVYATKYQLKSLDFTGEISLAKTVSFVEQSEDVVQDLDPRVASSKVVLSQCEVKDNIFSIENQSSQQRLFFTQTLGTESNISQGLSVKQTSQIVAGEELSLINLIYLSEISHTQDPLEESVALNDFYQVVEKTTYDQLKGEQEASYETFWQTSDVVITGNSSLQKGIRLNLYHLFQSAGRDGKTNFSAKGLTGKGYEGHYFWDTEMYMLPFFIYTQPEIAKQLLHYRLSILPQAQERAQQMGLKSGAWFAWRTINGEEASAYYPAGTAQVHINADIAYGFELYERITGDHLFIEQEASQVIFETARFWLNFGDWIESEQGQVFCINGVTGPDEYTAIVNNNYYTNKMAQNNLNYAVALGERQGQMIDQEEIASWRLAADKMSLPYDHHQQLVKQDESFFDKAVWDFAGTPKENYPLLLNYHPMMIYKYQVCKQADSLLAEMLFAEDYSHEQLTRDYHYYEQITTHDSSLSKAVFSIIASRIGEATKAYDYFMDTAIMDLEDGQGNVKDGIHAANMGGSWLGLVYGFAGLTTTAQGINLSHHLPVELTGLSFKLVIKGEAVEVTLTEDELEATSLAENSQLSIQQVTPKKVFIR